jgi:SOS-response transcriptional repressor LexA
MKQRDVAKAFGISSQAVSQWEAGRTRPDSQRLTRLVRLFDVRLEWLLDESGPMTVEGRAPSADAPHTTDVPVIDRGQVGDWTEVENLLVLRSARTSLQTDLEVSSSAFALVIEGQSMKPEFQPGDKVIIDPMVRPRPGDFVIAKRDNDQEATFKKYRLRNQDEYGRDVIELMPLNSDWPTLMIDRDNPGHIVGTMIEHRRYRRG